MKTRKKSIMLLLLAIVPLIYVSVLTLLFFFQAKLIFVPGVLRPDHVFHFPYKFEERWLEGEDGLRLNTLYFEAADARGTILLFHGNAGDLSSWGFVAGELAKRLAYNVWVLDYPGYGKSEGDIPSEDGLDRAVDRLYQAALKAEQGRESRLIVFGRSIGSGLAAKLASVHRPGGLVLESPYFSFESLVAEKLPWVPRFLVRYRFRSDLLAPSVACPVLVVHGERDEIIPVDHGRRLSALFPDGAFVPIADGRHNDLSEFEPYWSALQAFAANGPPQ